MLDGTSSELTITGEPGAASLAGATADVARPREPRREIWFRRRVHLVAALRELWSFRELMVTIAERDLRVRYKQAVLGVAWAVIGPVVMMLAFTFVINRFAKVSTGGVPYPVFAYMGLLPWTFFSSAISNGGLSLVNNSELLNKLYCPREVFPIAAIFDAMVDALIATVILVLLFPVTGATPQLEVYYVPLLLLVLVVFTLGVTLAVSAVVVYARDLRLVLPLAVQFGIFITPVMYSTGSISDSKVFLFAVSAINPLVPVIDNMRACILQGTAPEWASLGIGAASAFLYLLGGFTLFKRLETGMADIA